MPTVKEMAAVTSRIETLTGERFWAQGEFLRPVAGGSPQAGTPWAELDFDDRREAIYVNTDWKGFSLEQQMDVTDRVADGDPQEMWMDGMRANDRPEVEPSRPVADIAEMEPVLAEIERGWDSPERKLQDILDGKHKSVEQAEPDIGREREL
jgi:hypothetical protein